MKRPLVLLMLLLALLLSGPVARSQSTDPNEPWPIVEQCIPLETAPADWTFSGTLLMTSLGRLHAYRQEWDTPRILVFYSLDIPGTGLLSPDGRWFATISGERSQINFIVSWQTEAITVHSTNIDERYTVEWSNRFSAIHRLIGHVPYWLNNDHLLYSTGDGVEETWFAINPFTGAITDWQGPFNPTQFNFSLSPDSEKAVYYNWGDLSSILHNGEEEIEIPVYGIVAWRPDSSQFAAFTIPDNADTIDLDALAHFDVTGNLLSTIYDVPPGARVVWRMGKTWSPDGRYLSFATDVLYFADLDEQVVINTCIPTRSVTVAWAPTSTQVAIIESTLTDREIQILDLDNWERYIVAYHSGDVIGWRADEE